MYKVPINAVEEWTKMIPDSDELHFAIGEVVQKYIGKYAVLLLSIDISGMPGCRATNHYKHAIYLFAEGNDEMIALAPVINSSDTLMNGQTAATAAYHFLLATLGGKPEIVCEEIKASDYHRTPTL